MNNKKHARSFQIRWLPLFIAVGTLIISTSLLYLTAGVYGTIEGFTDTATYMGGAINLVQGHGLSLKVYDMANDTSVWQPITHYPPLTSIAYAGFLLLGIPLVSAPAATSLCCWVLLLIGIGILAYRLSDSWWAAATSMVIAALTSSYLLIFQTTMSEPLFLPLLVWSVLLLVDLPVQEQISPLRMAALIVLLALLMLTRYVGSVLFAAIVLWWFWRRIKHQQIRCLLGEVVILSTAFLPLAAWFVRNKLLQASAVGHHLAESDHTFWQGLSGVLNQMTQLLFPALKSLPPLAELQREDWGNLEPLIPWLHAGVQLAVLGILFLLGRRLWLFAQRHPQKEPLLKASPILPIIAIFIALYVFAQPFASFWPMDYRDSTTLLCLVQPYLIALLIRVLHSKAVAVLSIYVGVNLLLVVVPVALYGVPGVISFTPLEVKDLARNVDEIEYYNRHGIPEWLLITYSRTRYGDRHHPQFKAFLREIDREIALVSSMSHILFYDEQRDYLPAISMRAKYRDVEHWLQEGQCQSRYYTLLVLDPGVNDEYRDWFITKAAQKCPSLEPFVVDNMLVYRLGHKE